MKVFLGKAPQVRAMACVAVVTSWLATQAAHATVQVAIVASPNPAKAGELLDVEITVTNDGPFDRSDVQVVFEYPGGLNSLNNLLFDGDCPLCCDAACTSGEDAIFDIATLPAGKGITYSLPVIVGVAVTDGTVIDFNVDVFDDAVLQTSATDSIVIDSGREIELAMVEDRDPVAPSDTITYTITYGVAATSAGSLMALLSLPVPDGTSVIAASDGGVLNGDVVEWSLGNLNPGTIGERQVTFQVEGLTTGSIIAATASYSDQFANAVDYRTATRIENPIPLELVIVASPDPARANEALDLELSVINSGPFDRSDVILRLEVPQHLVSLNNLLFGGDCALCCDGACTASETAEFDLGTLPAGKGITFSVPFRVANAVTNGTVLSFEGEVTDSTGDLRESGASVAISSDRRLELALEESSDPATIGGQITYALTYGLIDSGTGLTNLVLRLPLPDAVSFVSASGGGTLNGDVVEWTIGTLNPGEYGERRLTVQVDEGAVFKAEAVLTSNVSNIVRYEAATRVEDDFPLYIRVVASPDPARPNETLDVELSVVNDGEFDLTGLLLTLEIPDHLTSINNLLFDGDCPLCCDDACTAQETAEFLIPSLAAGRGVTYSLPLRVAAGTLDGTVLSLEAQVDNGTGDQRESGTSITVAADRTLELGVVERSNPAVIGDEVTYSLTYGLVETGTGLNNVMLRLPVPEGTSFVSATDGGNLNSDVIEWSLGTLNPGNSGERTATVQIKAGPIVPVEATLTSSAANTVRVETSTRIEEPTPLGLIITAGPDAARPNETLDVELAVINAGSTDRTGVQLTLEIPDHLNSINNLYFDGDCQLCCDASCTATETAVFDIGTLPAGQGRTFSVNFRPAGATDDGTVISFEGKLTDNSAESRESGASIAINSYRTIELALAESDDPALPGCALTYRLTYGTTANGSGASNALLQFTLPDGVSFSDASDGGVLIGNVVEWSLGNLNPGSGGERVVLVDLNSGADPGSILVGEATVQSSNAGVIRVEESTRVEDDSPLNVEVVVSPIPAMAGSTLSLNVSVANTSETDRTGVVLSLEYPDDLNALNNTLFDGDCPVCCDAACTATETAIFDIGTLGAGQTASFPVPPVIALAAQNGTVIHFDAYAVDSTGFNSSGGDSVVVGSVFDHAEKIEDIPADLNNDDIVGPADLGELLAQWGRCSVSEACTADISPPCGDGIVGPADLAQLLASWG
jgi:hypothetical protein